MRAAGCASGGPDRRIRTDPAPPERKVYLPLGDISQRGHRGNRSRAHRPPARPRQGGDRRRRGRPRTPLRPSRPPHRRAQPPRAPPGVHPLHLRPLRRLSPPRRERPRPPAGRPRRRHLRLRRAGSLPVRVSAHERSPTADLRPVTTRNL